MFPFLFASPMVLLNKTSFDLIQCFDAQRCLIFFVNFKTVFIWTLVIFNEFWLEFYLFETSESENLLSYYLYFPSIFLLISFKPLNRFVLHVSLEYSIKLDLLCEYNCDLFLLVGELSPFIDGFLCLVLTSSNYFLCTVLFSMFLYVMWFFSLIFFSFWYLGRFYFSSSYFCTVIFFERPPFLCFII